MRLEKAQREAVIEWVVQGMEVAEVNRRASEFDPPFQVSKQQLQSYRSSRGVRVREIREASEDAVMRHALATVAGRLKKLFELEALLSTDVLESAKIWLKHKRAIGTGPKAEVVNEKVFNKSQVEQLRGVYDDIAREVGGRKQSIEIDQNVALNIVRLPAKLSPEEWQAKNG